MKSKIISPEDDDNNDETERRQKGCAMSTRRVWKEELDVSDLDYLYKPTRTTIKFTCILKVTSFILDF